MSKIDTSVGAVGREVESLKCRPDIPAAPGANARAAGMLDSLRSELTDTQAKLDLSKQANGILVEALKSAETKLAAARDDALEEAAVNSWQTLQSIIVKQNLGAGAYDYPFDVVMNIRALKSTPPQPEAKPAECEHVWVPQISADKVRCDKCGASYLAQHPWPADKDQWTAYAKPAQEAPQPEKPGLTYSAAFKAEFVDRKAFGHPDIPTNCDRPTWSHYYWLLRALDARQGEK